jgi:hypothetical protein
MAPTFKLELSLERRKFAINAAENPTNMGLRFLEVLRSFSPTE